MSGFRKNPKGFSTKAIHTAQDPDQWDHKSVVAPLITSTTFKLPGVSKPNKWLYSRVGNPTRDVLEKCVASLDNGKHGLVFSAGLGAITAVTQLLSAGDHAIVFDNVYGGTYKLFNQITSRMGVEVEFVDETTRRKSILGAIKENTRLIWFETPTNPGMVVIDIQEVARLAHSMNKKVIVAVDNTFLSPYFQRPLELGADIVSYSATKYLNGHSDVIMGALVLNDKDLYERLKFIQYTSGIIPGPFDCAQVNRGLKTLAVRMEQHAKSSLAVAKFLEGHPHVEKVLHPALPSHPQHEIALKQSYGHSGVFSFYIKGGLAESTKFLESLKLFILAVSLGGYESLAELPSLMTHADMPKDRKELLGVTDTLIRLSVGLEDVDDLINDLKQALQAAFP